MSRGKENKHYECSLCVNRKTPLCELCTQIISPSGNERKPKYYIGQGELTIKGGMGKHPKITDDTETDKLAKYLIDHILAKIPILTNVVLEYNRRTNREE